MVRFEAITGIEDKSIESNADELLIYPNPSECCFTVVSNLNCKSIKTIGVFNTTGQKVLEKQFNSEEITIDLSNYVSGMYFVKVKCGSDMVIGKIVNY